MKQVGVKLLLGSAQPLYSCSQSGSSGGLKINYEHDYEQEQE
ncbi:MAG: hypothetical protein ABI883_07845 [Chthoniobacterales bacterium]